VPSGAIPKDGPSAGVTMLSALVSLLTGKAMSPKMAMTGEITLRGAVLPIGGMKEKCLAALRAGIDTVVLPERNRKDLEDIPEEIRKHLTFHFVKEMHEVLKLALGVTLSPPVHPLVAEDGEPKAEKADKTPRRRG